MLNFKQFACQLMWKFIMSIELLVETAFKTDKFGENFYCRSLNDFDEYFLRFSFPQLSRKF